MHTHSVSGIERFWWSFLALWSLLLAVNVLLARDGAGFWLNLAAQLSGMALAVVNIIRIRRQTVVRPE